METAQKAFMVNTNLSGRKIIYTLIPLPLTRVG